MLALLLGLGLLVQHAAALTSTAFLTAPNGAGGDHFGAALDGGGTTLVVGAPGHGGAGAVYVYVRDGDAWVLEAELHAAGGASGDELGAAVALDGDTLVAGAPGRAGGSGAAYVFTRDGGIWTPRAQLVPDGASAGWRSGAAVDVAGDLVVVGAPGANGDTGTAAAFRAAGAEWTPIGLAVDAGALLAGDRAGTSVATDGVTVVVGAPRRDGSASAVDSGIVFVAERRGDLVTPVTSFESRLGRINDRFGAAVDVRGDAFAVGVPSGSWREGTSTLTAPGSLQLYAFENGSWRPRAILSSFGPGNTRGEAVRLGGTRVVSGAPYSEGEVGVAGEAAALHVGFRSGGAWVDGGEALYADLPEDVEVTSGLGTSVALTGDTVAGGAPALERVYLFQSRPPVFDAPPTARPLRAGLLETVRFEGAASDPDGDDVSVFWSFGDGNGTSVSPATHRYAAPGSFDAVLLASDGIGETAATVRVDVAAPTTTLTALELREKYKEALIPVGGGGEVDAAGEGEREVVASGKLRVKGTLPLTSDERAALEAQSRFRFALGGLLLDVGLGDDPAYAAGATLAEIALVDRGFADEGTSDVRYATLALDWSGGSLAFTLKLIPSKGLRFFTDPVLGATLAGTSSGRQTGVVTGAVAFGDASATVQRSYRAKVKTVDREQRNGRRVYRSTVKTKAKGAL